MVIWLTQGSEIIREFLASWHLVLVFQNKRDCQSVAKLILYATQKTQNCGHFISNLVGLRRKNI